MWMIMMAAQITTVKKKSTEEKKTIMQAMLQGNPTKADLREQERKEKQDELGICRIRRTRKNQSSETLGSGFVVKDLPIVQAIDCQYCLISSNKVFPNDCNINSYYLDFKKLNEKKLKTVKLEDIAHSTRINRDLYPGLVVIPIHPSQKCNKNESIFTYRPFKVSSDGRGPNQDLQCHFVDGMPIFSVKQLTLRQSETNQMQYQLLEALDGPFTAYNEVSGNGVHKPYGAAILKHVDDEYLVVGALTFGDDDRRDISPVFFHRSPGHEHCNQERNAATAEKTEASNLKQEATVSAAAAAETVPPHPDETSVESLTCKPVLVEAENTVDAGATDNETAQQPTPAANSFDHCYGEELSVPDPANADEVVNPNPNDEASRDEDSVSGHGHCNQERNAAVAVRTETPNLDQEATVSVAAATQLSTESSQPDETNVESKASDNIQEEAENAVDTGVADTATTQHPTPAANSYDHHHVSDIIEKDIKFVEDKLAPCLDHTPRHINGWEHLACTKEVNAPLETRIRCKLNKHYSPTKMLMDYLADSVEMEYKTVQDLIAELKAIERNEVVEIITAVYPENSTETICDFASSDSNNVMMDKIATKLDQKSRVVGYWIDLGHKFNIPGDKLKEIEYGQFNPTLALMEYLYSTQDDLTVRKFYDEAKKSIKRVRVSKKLECFLDGRSEELMKNVIELESDVMRGICVELNNPNTTLKNWRHLAYAFKIPREIYKDFNPEKPLSPTNLLFEWIFANRRDLTVGQLCAALKSIDRNDVVRKLRKYVEELFTGQE